MVPGAEPAPRRARYLIPKDLTRRGEVVAACAVAILVAHLLLAQLTLVLAVIFAAVSKASGWRRWWLLAPAGAGLAWTLAAGPGNALAGFTAGPSGILWHLGGGHLAGRAGNPLAGFAGAPGWLPRQFPVALVAGAAEAALIGWLDWLHTDEWAVAPPRPGLVAAARRAVAGRAIRAGRVVTREGAALGVGLTNGAVAELRWVEAAHGTLVVGAAEQDVTLAALQVVHAALRRRKPVIVLDHGDAAIARALDAACAATGTPLLTVGAGEGGPAVRVAAAAGSGTRDAGTAGASGLWGRGTARERRPGALRAGHRADPRPAAGEEVAGTLGRVVRERLAGLLPAGSTEVAVRACAELASLARDLRRIGVDGDALVWAPYGERVPAQALAGLLRGGLEAGLAVMVGTTSAEAAAELAALTGTALIYRVADPGLAACLAPRTGTRPLPRSLAAALAGSLPGAEPGPAAPGPGDLRYLGAAAPPPAAVAPGYPAGPAASPPPGPPAGADLVPGSAVTARALLELAQGEFVLAVSWPRPRLIAPGQTVPARLLRPAARRQEALGHQKAPVRREAPP
jgi:hypothetical protein